MANNVYTNGILPGANARYPHQQNVQQESPQQANWFQRGLIKLGLRVDPETVATKKRGDNFTMSAPAPRSVAGLQGLQAGGRHIKASRPEDALLQQILAENIDS